MNLELLLLIVDIVAILFFISKPGIALTKKFRHRFGIWRYVVITPICMIALYFAYNIGPVTWPITVALVLIGLAADNYMYHNE